MDHGTIGHNLGDIEVEVRLFNGFTRFAGPDGPCHILSLPAGSTVGDILGQLRIHPREVFLALQNGRDITASL